VKAIPRNPENKMSQPTPDRKRKFRIALALLDMTAKDWAAQNGCKGSHLSQVLSGDRESRRLEDAIDAFIGQTFKAHKVRAA
jgi:hypothetical protein